MRLTPTSSPQTTLHVSAAAFASGKNEAEDDDAPVAEADEAVAEDSAETEPADEAPVEPAEASDENAEQAQPTVDASKSTSRTR